jgi:hypothetical protein
MIMERELWKRVYQMVNDIANGSSIKRAAFDDARIVLVYLWAVLHDRPVSWACQKSNWPIYDWRKQLPTSSTMSRRMRTTGLQSLLRAVEHSFTSNMPTNLCRWIDAKPLPIGASSGDKQAGYGYAAGTKAKGYKLYAIADSYKGFISWCVHPMQCNETRIALELIPNLDHPGYLVGDSAYDSNNIYDLAATKEIQLIANKRKRGAGLGHYKHSKHRLRAKELLTRSFGTDLLEKRDQIERMFGQLTTFACGLKPLPNWVRTKFRVENWVRAKMIFFNVWRNHVSPNKI